MNSGPFKYSVEGGPSYLIVCDGGNVRSQAIATTLKLNYGREAIAIGRLFTRPETMDMLCNWAGRIILTQSHMAESIPEKYHEKIQVEDVGQDKWGIYIHPELNTLADMIAGVLVQGEGNG